MTNDLVVRDEVELAPSGGAPMNLFGAASPAEVIAKATEHSKALAAVIRDQHLYKTIGSHNHVLVEGWTLLGSMLGVFPVCVWSRPIEGGWEARIEARTLAGQVVGAAEASCLRSERNWQSRDDYALRSMAQTRATGKAMRLPLGFIVQLAGYSPTPAEEMPTAPIAAKSKPSTFKAPTAAEKKEKDEIPF